MAYYIHIKTYTDQRLSDLVRSHGQGGDDEIDVSFLAAVATELSARGVHFIPTTDALVDDDADDDDEFWSDDPRAMQGMGR